MQLYYWSWYFIPLDFLRLVVEGSVEVKTPRKLLLFSIWDCMGLCDLSVKLLLVPFLVPWESHVSESTYIAFSWFCNWQVVRARQMIQRASFVAAGISAWRPGKRLWQEVVHRTRIHVRKEAEDLARLSLKICVD